MEFTKKDKVIWNKLKKDHDKLVNSFAREFILLRSHINVIQNKRLDKIQAFNLFKNELYNIKEISNLKELGVNLLELIEIEYKTINQIIFISKGKLRFFLETVRMIRKEANLNYTKSQTSHYKIYSSLSELTRNLIRFILKLNEESKKIESEQYTLIKKVVFEKHTLEEMYQLREIMEDYDSMNKLENNIEEFIKGNKTNISFIIKEITKDAYFKSKNKKYIRQDIIQEETASLNEKMIESSNKLIDGETKKFSASNAACILSTITSLMSVSNKSEKLVNEIIDMHGNVLEILKSDNEEKSFLDLVNKLPNFLSIISGFDELATNGQRLVARKNTRAIEIINK